MLLRSAWRLCRSDRCLRADKGSVPRETALTEASGACTAAPYKCNYRALQGQRPRGGFRTFCAGPQGKFGAAGIKDPNRRGCEEFLDNVVPGLVGSCSW